MEIEKAVKYFNDCKPKYLKRFEEVTPEGNFIKGWICNKPNRYLGSLVIDSVNGEPHEQFVQSMPKIGYFIDERDIWIERDDGFINNCRAYEKLDGSCLIVYPLLDESGKYIMEIVPKTRGRAVADKNFLELFNKCDKSNIWNYYRENKGILYFELYGILNQHEIIHYDTGIDLKLIGEYTSAFTKDAILNYLTRYGFKRPDHLFTISKEGISINRRSKYWWYFRDVGDEYLNGLSVTEAITQIRDFLEYLNKTYIDMYGRLALEGVVLCCEDIRGKQKYIKIKPKTIETKHRSEHGIPKSDIRKEVLKYFDDYGADVYTIFRENPKHHTEYLNRMLSEDYDETMIKKSSKKIENIFMNVWNSKEVPKSIHNICNELVEKYGDNGITQCMRMFAQLYPYKKKDAKTIYNVLEIKFTQKGLEL